MQISTAENAAPRIAHWKRKWQFHPMDHKYCNFTILLSLAMKCMPAQATNYTLKN